MTPEEWDKLRAERPDLKLYPAATISDGPIGKGLLANYTREDLVTEMTADILRGYPPWAQDPFWGISILEGSHAPSFPKL